MKLALAFNVEKHTTGIKDQSSLCGLGYPGMPRSKQKKALILSIYIVITAISRFIRLDVKTTQQKSLHCYQISTKILALNLSHLKMSTIFKKNN